MRVHDYWLRARFRERTWRGGRRSCLGTTGGGTGGESQERRRASRVVRPPYGSAPSRHLPPYYGARGYTLTCSAAGGDGTGDRNVSHIRIARGVGDPTARVPKGTAWL